MTPSQNDSAPDPPAPRPAHPRCVESAELLRGERELHIQHGEETYRLIITRNGKLILQK